MSEGEKETKNPFGKSPETEQGGFEAAQESTSDSIGDASGSQDENDTAAPADAGSQAESAEGETTETPVDEVTRLKNALELLNDNHLRLQAEFDNVKKRMAKQHAESLRYALTPILTDLLGTMDNLERALEHARKEEGDAQNSMVEGLVMVQKHLEGIFEKFGLVRIEAVGQPFDPNLHEAMNVVETDEVEENQVIDVYQGGFQLHERVLRPAMVSVAKKPSGEGA